MQVLTEYTSHEECKSQAAKKSAAAALQAAQGTGLEGCKGLLSELCSLTKKSENEQGHTSTVFQPNEDSDSAAGGAVTKEHRSKSAARKPLIEEIC